MTIAASTSTLSSPATTAGVPSSVPGIPAVALDAYAKAAAAIAAQAPGVRGLTWALLAAIGEAESSQASGHTIAADGDVTPRIIGCRLDGHGCGGNTTPVPARPGTAALDGDTHYQHAVGPMQFLPATWLGGAGKDGNGDGASNPQNFYDAALATAWDLVGTTNPGVSVDLTDPQQLAMAIRRYNNSGAYVAQVIRKAEQYAQYNPATAVPIPGGTSGGQAVIAAALRWLGTPYLYGGGSYSGPTRGCAHGYCGTGFDCSGLVMYAVYQASGGRLRIPHNARTQWLSPYGTRIPVAQMQPGDAVYFYTDIHHMAIYYGNNRILQAPQTFDVVKISPIGSRYIAGVKRFL
jgi:cell wall-associated NlpC family hydrolase